MQDVIFFSSKWDTWASSSCLFFLFFLLPWTVSLPFFSFFFFLGNIASFSSFFYFFFFLFIFSAWGNFFFFFFFLNNKFGWLLFFVVICHFFILIGHHSLTKVYFKLIFSISPLFNSQPNKNDEKIKSFLSSHFSILQPFSILPLFHPSNQTDPKAEGRVFALFWFCLMAVEIFWCWFVLV